MKEDNMRCAEVDDRGEENLRIEETREKNQPRYRGLRFKTNSEAIINSSPNETNCSREAPVNHSFRAFTFPLKMSALWCNY